MSSATSSCSRSAANRFNLVGRAPALNWVVYHAETSAYDVTVDLDLRTALRTDGRRRSVPLPDPGARTRCKVIEKALGSAPPELRFFHTTSLTIAGSHCRRAAPRNGRSAGMGAVRALGRPGGGARGAARGRGTVRPQAGRADARIPPTRSSRAGSPHRCRPCTPATACGRIASGSRQSATKDRRRSAAASCPTSIEDYYFTPWDLGYGSYVKFDHDFVGRDALEGKSAKASIGRRSRSRSTTTT